MSDDAEYEEYVQFVKQQQDQQYNEYLAQNSDKLEIKDEIHPAIKDNLGSRVFAKGFGNDQEKQANYIKSQFPDMDVQIKKGDIVLRDAGETEYRKLDPGAFSIAEAGRDVADLAWDLTSMAVEGAATTAGFLAGSVPGAIAAGSAAGAGMEGIRQTIGQLGGMDQDFDAGSVAIAGLTGGIAAPIAGSGATLKQMGKSLLKKGYAPGSKELAAALIKSSKHNAGLIGNATSKVMTKGTSVLSGVDQDVIEYATRNMEAIENLDKVDLGTFMEGKLGKMGTKYNEARTKIGKEMGAAFDELDQKIDIGDLRENFDGILKEYEQIPVDSRTADMTEKIATVRSELENIFGATKKVDTGIVDESGKNIIRTIEPETIVTPEKALALKESLSDLAQLGNTKMGLADRFGKSKPVFQKRLAGAAGAAWTDLSTKLDNAVEALADNGGSSIDIKGLKSKYKELKLLQGQLGNKFSNPETAFNILSNMNKKNKRVLMSTVKRADKALGTNLTDEARLLSAYSTFGKPDGLYGSVQHYSKVGGVGAMLGGAAGAEIARSQGASGFLGAGVGGAVPALLLSPGMIKAGIKTATKTPLVRAAIKREVMKDISKSVYEALKKQGNNR